MSTMVPMYGFGGGGGTGAALTVTAPAAATVTVSKDGKSKTKVADTDGVAVFKGLSTGDWTLSITDGEQTAQKTVTITTDYTTAITFFAATIHVTYPAGSKCTATDGVTTLTAPADANGTWDCVVENAGLWTVSLDSGFAETIDVTTSGETYTIDRWYLYNQGDEHEAITGGWSTDGYTGVSKEAEKYDTYIHIKYASGEYEIGTQNAIPFNGFSKLCVDVPEMTGLLYLGANAKKDMDIYGATQRLDIKNTTGIKTMAIDNQSSSFYVQLGPSKSSGCNAKVSKVWLEV